MATEPPQPTIAEAAGRCFDLFQQCMQQSTCLSPKETSLIEDQLARFSLWTANIGVFSPGRMSLDHRLREAQEVHEVIIGVSESLEDHLQECFVSLESHRKIESSTDEELQSTELESLMKGCAGQIALLHRLSNTIRKASMEDHNAKASNLFRILDAEGNDVEPCLRDVFSHYIRDKFPEIDEDILQRLALAMVARRKRVLYKRYRFGGTALNVQEIKPQPILNPPTHNMPQAAPSGKASARTDENDNELKQNAKSNEKSQAGLSATTLAVDKYRKASAPSMVSTAKTIAFDNYEELPVPVAPIGRVRRKYRRMKRAREEEHKQRIDSLDAQSRSGLPFDVASAKAHAEQDLRNDVRRYWEQCLEAIGEVTCPFCFYAIPTAEANDITKWRAHVRNDLDAYVCMFEHCDTPDQLYRHSEDWLKHMSQHALRWCCNSKSHGQLTFDTREKYIRHVTETHKKAFNDAQLQVLADRSARTLDPLFESCPFCGFSEPANGARIEEHIVGHLRFLALRSLPPYDDVASDTSDDESASSRISKPCQRSTIDQDPDRHLYPTFDDEECRPSTEVTTDTNRAEAEEQQSFEIDTKTPPCPDPFFEYPPDVWNRTTEKRLLEWGFVTEELDISTDVTNDPVLRELSLTQQYLNASSITSTDLDVIYDFTSRDRAIQSAQTQVAAGKLDTDHTPVSDQGPIGSNVSQENCGLPKAGDQQILLTQRNKVDTFQPEAGISNSTFNIRIPFPSTSKPLSCSPIAADGRIPRGDKDGADTTSDTPAMGRPPWELSRLTVGEGSSLKKATKSDLSVSTSQPSTESVAGGSKLILDSELDGMISRLLGSVGSFRMAPCLTRDEVVRVCVASREVFMSQPMLLELEAPLKVVGDVHGQYFDLVRIFQRCGFPPTANYLFLGDYVDRGKQSLEVVLLLFCYKLKYPENMLLLRGNHECASINRIYGFYDECKRRYDIKIWKAFSDVFNCLPVAAIIDESIFCVHGGLSPDLTHMDQIRQLTRPTDVPDAGLLCDLLWSDPDLDASNWQENDRGVSYVFDKNIVGRFLEKNGFDLICRAHQVVEDGYEFFADRLLVTIFSATNYCGEFDNAGGVMSVSEELVCSFEIIKPHLIHRKGYAPGLEVDVHQATLNPSKKETRLV